MRIHLRKLCTICLAVCTIYMVLLNLAGLWRPPPGLETVPHKHPIPPLPPEIIRVGIERVYKQRHQLRLTKHGPELRDHPILQPRDEYPHLPELPDEPKQQLDDSDRKGNEEHDLIPPGIGHPHINDPFRTSLYNYKSSVWPNPAEPYNDRILQQLALEGPKASEVDSSKFKTILAFSGSDAPEGQKKFTEDGCGVDTCFLTTDVRWAHKADAVIFNFDPGPDTWDKPPHQVWILFMLESPVNSPSLVSLSHNINWTATYRSDSTLVTPYEKFVPYADLRAARLNISHSQNNTPFSHNRQIRSDYSANKTRMVAWFVSNCATQNKRMEFARELEKYISLDIYGACGDMQCPKHNANHCFTQLQKHYKFYLSFENSNCEYYITEKLFWNALGNDVIPVVMGGRRTDYESAAPPGSFIHIEDFAGPKELADYLLLLSRDPVRYNSYFKWKGTGEFINTKFYCRLCALLHAPAQPHWFPDVEQWWRHPGACTYDRWDRKEDAVTDWEDIIG